MIFIEMSVRGNYEFSSLATSGARRYVDSLQPGNGGLFRANGLLAETYASEVQTARDDWAEWASTAPKLDPSCDADSGTHCLIQNRFQVTAQSKSG